jgi:metal-responsive CopG/Arc/MetJ family transcriptional regulator
MKGKISITLEQALLKEIDRLAGAKLSRSAFIEHLLREYLRDQARRDRNARDLELINAAADRLNLEAEDVLGYQAPEE